MNDPIPIFQGDAAPFDGVLVPPSIKYWTSVREVLVQRCFFNASGYVTSIVDAHKILAAGRPLRAGDRVRCGDMEGEVSSFVPAKGFTYIMWDDRKATTTAVPTSALTRLEDEES